MSAGTLWQYAQSCIRRDYMRETDADHLGMLCVARTVYRSAQTRLRPADIDRVRIIASQRLK